MNVEIFSRKIRGLGIDTITGIPDSTLKVFCDYIGNEGKSIFTDHIVTENEGASIGIAIGEYLATGRPACVYMQNSGLGNIVNPITSLANRDVYGIPMLLLTGWRGEPGIKDEPQHKFMGKITEDLLKVLEIPYTIIGSETTEEELDEALENAGVHFRQNKQYAFLIRKNTFEKRRETVYHNTYQMAREKAIEVIVKWLQPDDIVVSTTGKISREVYEESDRLLGGHEQIFLTVGGMGHASMIAWQLARKKPDKKAVCLDGDGALLMHMGSLAVIGAGELKNMVHICLNNAAHESVGGMPTGAAGLSYEGIAQVCGYGKTCFVKEEEELEKVLAEIRNREETVFLEVGVSIGSRADLGRPEETAEENKNIFMRHNGVKS